MVWIEFLLWIVSNLRSGPLSRNASGGWSDHHQQVLLPVCSVSLKVCNTLDLKVAQVFIVFTNMDLSTDEAHFAACVAGSRPTVQECFPLQHPVQWRCPRTWISVMSQSVLWLYKYMFKHCGWCKLTMHVHYDTDQNACAAASTKLTKTELTKSWPFARSLTVDIFAILKWRCTVYLWSWVHIRKEISKYPDRFPDP